ncbi:3-methyl-2-oxobutanoate hydroxymethyltransferase [Comamonas denitrificans]|uniref:3-methyl-2-oxobutanoate hydroxymethyltransferase n=1 Tax=Comamonas denitrificans TaxID=117506 RepID=A0A939GZW7_9BURK|nr:3-methyl-2-oxobutanoate hydroxymethyltransferase [Comamonas denitrificans]MBO1249353.1 3-methyl-2-oxobutanoate hydroxymethyltransferase [Comamonas denitrificans]
MSADTAAAGTPYGTIPPASPLPQRKPISLPRLAQLRAAGEKITMLTAYDATFAAVADAAGVETILVGDSLGMVCQGLPSTVGVSLETMAYHTASVARGLRRAQGTAWVVADLPYGSYQESAEQAMRSATVLMQAGAHMVKLEGGGWTAPIVRFLVERGIPVCAHLGLTPQTVHALGGYRVQGRGDEGAAQLRRHALQLQDMGASMLVLEMVPAELSARLTEELPHCHTIGIGAGNGTAGQVLVLHDMLGMNLGKMPKFVRNFMQETGSIKEAMAAYVRAVKDGSFPDNTLHAW